MNFRRSARQSDEARIDLTPMLDVVFNLVLFFVVSTNFEKEQQNESPGIQVDLPRSSAQVIQQQDQDLQVFMAVDGSIHVGSEVVDLAGLKAVFRERAGQDPNTLVVIKADTGVSHGRVVAVMDVAKSQGLARMAIATRPNTDAP